MRKFMQNALPITIPLLAFMGVIALEYQYLLPNECWNEAVRSLAKAVLQFIRPGQYEEPTSFFNAFQYWPYHFLAAVMNVCILLTLPFLVARLVEDLFNPMPYKRFW